MCTLTFVPLEEPNSFILTSNRDELATRSKALFPAEVEENGRKVIFPKDEKGGSWIAANNEMAVCLLNGGLKKHVPAPPYRMSRGLVVLNAFKLNGLREYYNKEIFEGIEPFTLVSISLKDKLWIREFVWTGEQIFLDEKPGTQPFIWSSVTLYSPEEIYAKQQYFLGWMARHPAPTPEQLRALHRDKFEEELNKGFSINLENKVLTVSITSLVKEGEKLRMHYEEVLDQVVQEVEIK